MSFHEIIIEVCAPDYAKAHVKDGLKMYYHNRNWCCPSSQISAKLGAARLERGTSNISKSGNAPRRPGQMDQPGGIIKSKDLSF